MQPQLKTLSDWPCVALSTAALFSYQPDASAQAASVDTEPQLELRDWCGMMRLMCTFHLKWTLSLMWAMGFWLLHHNTLQTIGVSSSDPWRSREPYTETHMALL